MHQGAAGWQSTRDSHLSPLWGLTIPAAVLMFPFGLVAVYFSMQVNQRLQEGDVAGAAKNSQLAKTWGIIFLAVFGFLTLGYMSAV